MDITKLSELRPGQRGRIHAVHAEEGFLLRLQALGFRRGRPVEVVRSAAFRGPLQLRVGSASLALRRADAERIEVTGFES